MRVLHILNIDFCTKWHLQVQHCSYFWNSRTMFASHSPGYFNMNDRAENPLPQVEQSDTRLRQTFPPEGNFTSSLSFIFFPAIAHFFFPSSFTLAPLMSVYGGSICSISHCVLAEGMRCKPSPVSFCISAQHKHNVSKLHFSIALRVWRRAAVTLWYCS